MIRASLRTNARLAIRIALASAVVVVVLPLQPERAVASPSQVFDPSEVRSGHPRVIASDEALNGLALQAEQDPRSKELANAILVDANRMLNEAPITYEPDSSLAISGNARTFQARAFTLPIAWKLTGNDNYMERLEREIDSVLAFRDWNTSHFLFASELTLGMAVAYDWGFDYFPAAKRAAIAQAIVDEALEPSLLMYERDPAAPNPFTNTSNWPTERNNRNIVTNAGLGTAALAVMNDVDSDVPERVLSWALETIPNGLAAFAPDGGYPEGPTYWEYATNYMAIFVDALRTSTGSDQGLATAPGIASTPFFGIDLLGPSGAPYRFSDTAQSYDTALTAAGMSRILGDESLSSFSAASKSKYWASLQLLWRDPDVSPNTNVLNNRPLDSTYLSAGVGTSRGSWSDSRATFTGFRFGSNPSLSHEHADGGDFGLQALGIEWGTTFGWDRATYSEGNGNTDERADRWDYYNTRPEGHNTISFDITNAHSFDPRGSTQLLRSDANATGAYHVADLSDMYPETVSSWNRGVRLFDHRTSVLVQDEYATTRAAESVWGMHTQASITIAGDGRSAVLHQDGERLLAQIVSQGDHSFTEMPALPYATSPLPAQDPNNEYRKLAIEFVASGTGTIAVQFTPLQRRDSESADPIAVTPLSQWVVDPIGTHMLTDLRVDGETVEGFDPDTLTYAMERDPSAPVPIITASAGTGVTIEVSEPSRSPSHATVTASGSSGAVRTYKILFHESRLEISAVSASRTIKGNPELTLDNNASTGWSTWGDETITWQFAHSAVVNSVNVRWSTNTTRRAVFEVDTSSDGIEWTRRYEGEHRGPSGFQSVTLNPGPASKYIRFTVHGNPDGDRTTVITDINFYERDINAGAPPLSSSTLDLIQITDLPSLLSPGEASSPTVTALDVSGQPLDFESIRLVSSDSSVIEIVDQNTVVARSLGSARVGALVTVGRVQRWASVEVVVTDPVRMRIYASEDTYVEGGSTASHILGDRAIMVVKPADAFTLPNGTSVRYSYAKFDLSGVPEDAVVASASLSMEGQLTDTSPNVDSIEIDARAMSDGWSEGTTNWTNQPGLEDQTVGTMVVDRTRAYRSMDVTEYVASHASASDLSFGFTQNSPPAGRTRFVRFQTRESGNPPYLDITLENDSLKVSSVTASRTVAGTPEATIDMDPSSSWRTSGHQTITWQLADTTLVSSLRAQWTANSAQRIDYEIDTSPDGLSWTRRYEGQHLGPSGVQEITLNPGPASKYVRFTVHGDNTNDLVTTLNEVSFYGNDINAGAPELPDRVLGSIEVPTTPIALDVGKTAQLEVAALDSTGVELPSAELSFTTRDDAVATVTDSGLVAAVGTGTAVGTATTTIDIVATHAGKTVSASVEVVVTDPVRMRIYASEDTYVEGGSTATHVLGNRAIMVVRPADPFTQPDGTSVRYSFARFDLSDIPDNAVIASAVLAVNGQLTDATPAVDSVEIDARAVNDSWSEASTNWNNRPTLEDQTVGTMVIDRTSDYRTMDVTDYVSDKSTTAADVSFGLTQNAAASTRGRFVRLQSRESGSPPYLDITFDVAP